MTQRLCKHPLVLLAFLRPSSRLMRVPTRPKLASTLICLRRRCFAMKRSELNWSALRLGRTGSFAIGRLNLVLVNVYVTSSLRRAHLGYVKLTSTILLKKR